MSLSTPLVPTSLSKSSTKSKQRKSPTLPNFMNKKFIYFSIIFWLIFGIFINLVAPVYLWTKILFFLIVLSCFLSTVYVFSKNHCLNLIISFYFLSLLLLRFFHQLFLMNFVIITCLFICLFFIFYKKETC